MCIQKNAVVNTCNANVYTHMYVHMYINITMLTCRHMRCGIGSDGDSDEERQRVEVEYVDAVMGDEKLVVGGQLVFCSHPQNGHRRRRKDAVQCLMRLLL
eukprot:m.34823 g.34823  ORF g.34823 m.34823 type:complete len:100 (+) comp17042_c2_seq1:264-563(+)